MPSISRSSIENIRERVNIYDVVSDHVTLKRSGSSWKGLSPFSNEKTPSFYVHPEKNFFYCFSSQQGGDLFRFLQLKENLNFQEAVEYVANRFNLPIEYENTGKRAEPLSLRKELFTIYEIATNFFHRAFKEQTIRDYWTKERKFSLQLANEFLIGFAPPDGNSLITELLKAKISLSALQQSGLFFFWDSTAQMPNRWKMRFRGRLMIPIRDIQGRVIAFTARQLPCTPKDDPAYDAKYTNSPETLLFKKSELLFNLDRARSHFKEREIERPALLVEGQLDALRCWEKGLLTAIAPQGTAITENQLCLLRRYTKQIDCLLDGDSAGQKAALRLVPLTIKTGLDVRFLVLPEGSDPDKLLAEGGREALEPLRKKGMDAIAFVAKTRFPSHSGATAMEKAEAIQELFAIILHAESVVAQKDYLRQLAHLLRLDLQSLEMDFGVFTRSNKPRSRSPNQVNAQKNKNLENEKLTTAEYELLLVVLFHYKVAKAVSQVLLPEWVDNKTLAGKLLDRFLAEWRETGENPCVEEMLETEEERNFIYQILSKNTQFEAPVKVANACLKRLYTDYFYRHRTNIERQMAVIDNDNKETLQSLQAQRIQIREALKHPPQITEC